MNKRVGYLHAQDRPIPLRQLLRDHPADAAGPDCCHFTWTGTRRSVGRPRRTSQPQPFAPPTRSLSRCCGSVSARRSTRAAMGNPANTRVFFSRQPGQPGGGDDGAAGTGVSARGAGQRGEALGVPLPGRRSRLAARPARRLRSACSCGRHTRSATSQSRLLMLLGSGASLPAGMPSVRTDHAAGGVGRERLQERLAVSAPPEARKRVCGWVSVA
jgi:hypothetical protein